MKSEIIEFDWSDTGRLEVLLHGNDGAIIRFTPKDLVGGSKTAQFEDLSEGIHQHQESGKTSP